MRIAQKALLASSLLVLGAGMSASAVPKLNGAGASFPAKYVKQQDAKAAAKTQQIVASAVAKAMGNAGRTPPAAMAMAVAMAMAIAMAMATGLRTSL